ncbi:hypothetical protein ACUOBA_34975, partial [Escherichia coli]
VSLINGTIEAHSARLFSLTQAVGYLQYSDECNNLVCYALAMLAHRQQPTTNKKERMVLVVEG